MCAVDLFLETFATRLSHESTHDVAQRILHCRSAKSSRKVWPPAKNHHKSPSSWDVLRARFSRELRRNRMRRVEYFASQADWLAGERPHASKQRLHSTMSGPGGYVREKLSEEWSPEQIAGRLREEYPDDGRMRISHETIYASIDADRREGGTLWKQLRRHHRRRRPRGSGRQRRGGIVGRVGIEERPAIVEKRSRKGDWEGDTVAGKSGRLVTLVERQSRFVVLAKVPDKRAASVNRGGSARWARCRSSSARR